MSVEARGEALRSLAMIANDADQDSETRIEAANSILMATSPAPSQREQDEALRQVGDQVAERVLEVLHAAGVR